MSDLDHDRWQRLDELFAEAVRHTGAAREAFLDRACAGRPAARSAVERMLWADAEAGSFLEDPVARFTAAADGAAGDPGGAADEVGRQLGRYRLVALIAAGGMGAVYRAERADDTFEQAVAVKMMRRRMVRAEDLQRFRTERQVLARLDHPNIARLLDGGTTDGGRPFLVMELVDGKAIDRYVATRGLGLRARIALFEQVCAAIEHAHQNLLIHRDVKPDNILVTAGGTVKVLDFGIAKLLEPGSLPFAAPQTRTGVRPMTPGYASPEQVRGQPVTTRSEVFVLGALCYELLTGRSPFLGQGALAHQVESAICAIDGLPAGTRRSTRGGDPCARALRGDLGTVVGKALRADPARRYGSVAQLAEDLRRWAEHRPVRARPDRLGYRLRTFLRRNRTPVSLAAAAFAGLVALSLALLVQARTVAGERDRAEQALRFVSGIFDGAAEDGRGVPPADPRQLLDRGAERIERELGEHADMQAVLFDAVGGMYTSLGWYDEARRRLEQALAIQRRLAGGGAEEAAMLYRLGQAYKGLGDYQQARARFAACLSLRRELLGLEHPAVAEALAAVADADVLLGRYAEAEPNLREALRLRRRHLGDDHLAVAESWSRLGEALYGAQRDAGAALDAFRKALAIREPALGEDHILVANSLGEVAGALTFLGRYPEALRAMQRAVTIKRAILDGDHPELASGLYGLGEIARGAGELELSEAALREAVALAKRRLGALHPETAHPQLSLGALLVHQGRLDEADDLLQQVETVYRATLPADHSRFAPLFHFRAELERRRGRYDQARRLHQESWRITASYTPENASRRAWVKMGIARLEVDTGRPEVALGLFREALAIFQGRPTPPSAIGEVEAEIGHCLALLGRLDEGRSTVLRGLERLEGERRADDPKVRRARAHLDAVEALAAESGRHGAAG